MAKGDRVKREEDVLRYVGEIDRDGAVISGGLFLRRDPQDTDGVSVNRLGILVTDDLLADVKETCKVLAARGMPITSTTSFVQINVGIIEDIGEALDIEAGLVVIEWPTKRKGIRQPANPAHALIVGLPYKAFPQADLISDRLRQAVTTVHPALV